jgi:tetratricopeptide (TPR) repeat protein
MIMLFRLVFLPLFAILLASCSSVAQKSNNQGDVPSNHPELSSDPSSQVPGTAHKADSKPEEITEISADTLYKLLVAEVAAQRGEIDVAMENYLDVAKSSRDAKAASRATQLASYAQDYDKAIDAATLWIEIEPENADAHRVMATLLLKHGRVAEVVPQYQKMLEILEEQNRLSGAYLNIAQQLSRHPERSMVLSVMEKLVSTRQDDPAALFASAHLAMRLASFDVALKNLNKVLRIKPDWGDAIILRSRIVSLQDGKDKALVYLEEVLQGDLLENVQVGLFYARMLTESRRLKDAYVEFKRLAAIAPKHANVQYFSGVLALQLKKLDEAREYLHVLLKLGKRKLEANYYLGQAAELGEDTETALAHYSRVKRGEYYFNAQVRVVALLAETDEFDRAREHLHTIRVTDQKQQLQTQLLEGDLLREAERLPEAKEFYTTILKELPDETSIRYARALVAEKLGELDLLESDLQKILELEPKNAQVLNALGYTLADRTDRFTEALGYIKTALELEPDDAAVMDSMGWVQYRLGNYQQAIEHLKRANEQAKDPEIAAHLGEVMWVSGRKTAAIEVWEGSLKENPGNELLLSVMKRFGM